MAWWLAVDLVSCMPVAIAKRFGCSFGLLEGSVHLPDCTAPPAKLQFKCLCSIVWSCCFNFRPNTVYLRFLLEIKDRSGATKVLDCKLRCWWGLQLKDKEWEKGLEMASWLEGQACAVSILRLALSSKTTRSTKNLTDIVYWNTNPSNGSNDLHKRIEFKL